MYYCSLYLQKTDKRQTRLLVKEGALQRQDSNFEGGRGKIWSQVSDLARHQDGLSDRQF
jgi:hypothetical protein